MFRRPKIPLALHNSRDRPEITVKARVWERGLGAYLLCNFPRDSSYLLRGKIYGFLLDFQKSFLSGLSTLEGLLTNLNHVINAKYIRKV